MASVKIGQLVIRTLAKPIANQLKTQAANHETFRRACIGLAQFMHKSELKLRSNLIGGGATHQKIRPLNDSKAIANGANAISEGFLFAVAAALIIGETYRGSRNRAKQRDSTEAAVEEVRVLVENLAQRLDIPLEEIKPPPEAFSDDEEDGSSSSEFSSEKEEAGESRSSQRTRTRPRKMSDEEELERLRASTQILLQMALRSGWIQGEEALRLDDILQGRDTKKGKDSNPQSGTETTSRSNNAAPSRESQEEQSPSSPSILLQTSASSTTSNPSSASAPTSSQPAERSKILAAIAQERVKAMISEMNDERKRGVGLEGEGGSEGWTSSSKSTSDDDRPRGESGDEGDALGAASRLAEMLERAGAGVSTKQE